MSLVLHVDGDRWRTHLRSVMAARPGLVPVIKGNGYGFGNHRLARRAAWLGVDTVAVGTYEEVAEVASRCDADIVVLTPWRPWIPVPADRRVIHTVGRLDDLRALAERPDRPRVVLERLTSMKRHGFTPRGLRNAVAFVGEQGGVRLEGISLHLPLAIDDRNLVQARELLTDVVSTGLADTTIWVSHLAADAVEVLAREHPGFTFRSRIGTELWLGDREALRPTARVLDVHPVDRGERFGYRQRPLPRGGHLVVVAGGTAHGIGLTAPTGEGSPRARAATLARGGLDAVGLAKSPFTIAGKARYFAEPPHMQASMILLPGDTEPPVVGDEVPVRVRFTTTSFDAVQID